MREEIPSPGWEGVRGIKDGFLEKKIPAFLETDLRARFTRLHCGFLFPEMASSSGWVPGSGFGGNKTLGVCSPVPGLPPGELPGSPILPPAEGGIGRFAEGGGSGKEGMGIGWAFS